MLVEVEISSFALDPSRNTPVIILKEVSGKRTLPVPIGPLEASAIAIESLKVTPDKPLTIDLTRIIMEQLGGKLTRVIISDIVENSLHARLQIVKGNGAVAMIDCRPSDALALAMRCKTPLYAMDLLFDKIQNGNSLSEEEKLRKHISSIDTLDFGRYILE
jgi:bifunctional DNase/RNase